MGIAGRAQPDRARSWPIIILTGHGEHSAGLSGANEARRQRFHPRSRDLLVETVALAFSIVQALSCTYPRSICLHLALSPDEVSAPNWHASRSRECEVLDQTGFLGWHDPIKVHRDQLRIKPASFVWIIHRRRVQ